MKLLLTMVCLLFVGLPFQAHAAKKDWYVVKHGDSLDVKGGDDDFADAYSFYVPLRVGQTNQTQTYVITIDEIKDFAAVWVGANKGKSRNQGKGHQNRVDRLTELLVANLSSTLNNNLSISGEGSPLAVSPLRDQTGDDQPPAQGGTPSVFQPAPSDDPQPIRVVGTPIPAALWLFGTALLGLIGIRLQAKAK